MPIDVDVEEIDRKDEIAQLREEIESLSAIHRPSASEGEREAATWIDERFRELGLSSRIEPEPAHGTYWLPIGIPAAVASVGGLAALRGHRVAGALLGGLAAASIWDDLIVGMRPLRRALAQKTTYNVVAELGPEDAERTVVLIGHHDAARSGLIFNPAIPRKLNEIFPKSVENIDTSPPLTWPLFAGPALVALGSLINRRGVVKTGTALSVLTQLLMAEIASREVVPGANDNASGVVSLLGVARALKESPPEGLRVVFLSAGSEESLEEGSEAFGKRHFGSLPVESTFFICIDGVASPHLLCLEGEGMMKMFEYPEDAKSLVFKSGEDLGIDIWKGLRLRNATDGLVPLRAGYKCVSIASCTDLKQPVNYHWPTDTPDCLTYDTLHNAVRLVTEVIRRLDRSWVD